MKKNNSIPQQIKQLPIMYLLCHVNYYTLKYSLIPTMLVQKIRHNVTND